MALEASAAPCGAWCNVAMFVVRTGICLAEGCSWQKLLDPYGFGQWFASLFAGRPKLGPNSATDNAAISALSAVNPVWRVYGAGLRLLETQGVAISTSSGPGRTALNNLTATLHADLINQFGDSGSDYFNKGINYLFNFCTNAPCASVFQADPVYRLWVQQGKLRGSDGYPLWRQPKPPPAAPPPPIPPPAVHGSSTPPPPPVIPPPPPAKPQAAAPRTIYVCGHRINLVGTNVEQTQQTRNAQLAYCPLPIIPPPPTPPPVPPAANKPCPCAGPMPAPNLSR